MAQIPGPAKERLLSLMRLLEKQAGGRITSGEVEALTGWSSHTIRKDISYLGGAAGNSTGYDPETLIPAIKQALGLGVRRRLCVVGLGRLGSAYLNFRGFDTIPAGPSDEPGGEFELAAGFDTSVNRVEILQSPVPLYPAFKMGEVISRFGIELALLCVPEAAAQSAAEKLAAAGIRGIVNFAPLILQLPPEIAVRNVYVVDELRALALKLSE
ncbi:CoA-binding protein [Treponema primitia]|uniref:CoA-binding protein n=1 Tax=Treponema primitia TaxID=88058 RepID=UPI00025553E8|nr:CoA-binding protein [Treponema primitia]